MCLLRGSSPPWCSHLKRWSHASSFPSICPLGAEETQIPKHGAGWSSFNHMSTPSVRRLFCSSRPALFEVCDLRPQLAHGAERWGLAGSSVQTSVQPGKHLLPLSSTMLVRGLTRSHLCRLNTEVSNCPRLRLSLSTTSPLLLRARPFSYSFRTSATAVAEELMASMCDFWAPLWCIRW